MDLLTADVVRANAAHVRERIAAAAARSGRDPREVELLAAVKYVRAADIAAIADAGIELVGENRAQALVEKVAAPGAERLRWHFIGALQSRKLKLIAPRVELIHSVASESALRALSAPGPDLLIQVNVAGDPGKEGVAPGDLDRFIERSPLPVVGLMTMPPAVISGQDNRRWFAMLRELAAARGLRRISMGTTQDYEVAVEEGATIVRVGSVLFGPSS